MFRFEVVERIPGGGTVFGRFSPNTRFWVILGSSRFTMGVRTCWWASKFMVQQRFSWLMGSNKPFLGFTGAAYCTESYVLLSLQWDQMYAFYLLCSCWCKCVDLATRFSNGWMGCAAPAVWEKTESFCCFGWLSSINSVVVRCLPLLCFHKEFEWRKVRIGCLF